MSEQSLGEVVEQFPLNPIVWGRTMRQRFEAGPAAFFDEAVPILRTDCSTHGVHYLVTLLLINDLILKAISDPELFSLPESTRLAQILLRIEPMLDIKMARGLTDEKDPGSKRGLEDKAVSARGTRVLEILSVISDGARILPVMAQLLRHPNAWVRSKAALMVGRSNKNHKWVSQQLEQSDPRVRANAIESLWGVDSEGSRLVFWGALGDSDNRVVGNALLALYRLGEAASIKLIVDLLKHEGEDFRITGIWVMGESGDQRFVGLLARYFSDPAPDVRSAAFRSVAKIKKEGAKLGGRALIEVDLSAVSQLDGQARVIVTAWAEAPEKDCFIPVSGQKATHFAIYQNSEIVTSYEVQEFSAAESNVIAFAIPRLGETDNPFHAACVQGFDLGLRHKRKAENWLVLKYLPEREREAAVSVRVKDASVLGLEHEGEPAPPEVWPLPPEARFSSDSAVIAESVQAMGTRMSMPPSLPQAATTLLSATAQSRGSKHLVFLHHPLIGDSGATSWPDLARQARTAKVAIHTIALEDCPGLRTLSEKTGGIYQQLAEVSKLPRAIQSLCARLINHYEIGYRPAQLEAAITPKVRIQLYSEHGFGEQTCTPSMQPQVEVALAG